MPSCGRSAPCRELVLLGSIIIIPPPPRRRHPSITHCILVNLKEEKKKRPNTSAAVPGGAPLLSLLREGRRVLADDPQGLVVGSQIWREGAATDQSARSAPAATDHRPPHRSCRQSCSTHTPSRWRRPAPSPRAPHTAWSPPAARGKGTGTGSAGPPRTEERGGSLIKRPARGGRTMVSAKTTVTGAASAASRRMVPAASSRCRGRRRVNERGPGGGRPGPRAAPDLDDAPDEDARAPGVLRHGGARHARLVVRHGGFLARKVCGAGPGPGGRRIGGGAPDSTVGWGMRVSGG
jgi:hypothetical protein